MSGKPTDYAVGYGKPPIHTRFRKGQSGNPEGRPKGRRNLITDVIAELSESLSIREGGMEKRVTKQRAIVKAMVSASLKGDVRATGQIIGLLAQALEVEPLSSEREAVSAADRAIFDRFIEREIAKRAKG